MPPSQARLAYRTKKQREAAAAQSTLVMLTMFDGLISMSLGEECRFTDQERALIEPPLQRMLLRLDPAITGAIEKYTDPLLIVMGLISWGARVWNIQMLKMRAAREAARAAQPTPEAASESAAPEFVPTFDENLPPSPRLDILEGVMP